jgi:site-specific DNA-methyltransferase (adenine-specific)
MIDLIKGDCLEVMKTIKDNSIDAIITDPPYGTTACKWDSVIDFDLMWEQLNRIIKPNGAIVLFGSQPFTSALISSNYKMFKYEWIWKKNIPTGFTMAKTSPMKLHENIIVFSNGNLTYNSKGNYLKFNPQKTKRDKPIKGYAVTSSFLHDVTFDKKERVYNDKNPVSIIEYKKVKNGLHTSQKPIALMEYLIKTYTNEGEKVLDFTMGSGSAGVACKNLNRNFIGIEQDETYFNIATKRIKETLN